MPPIDDYTYTYVDTASGGVHRRNRVMLVTEHEPAPGSVDCYRTWFRFNSDFADYAAGNPSPATGKPPSVAGYPGPALASFLPFDFDDEQEPARALADAASFVRMLDAHYELPASALRIYWSGLKGISVEIPAALFGGFQASEHLPAVLRRVAETLAASFDTADFSIYEKLRLWRVPNTRHSRSGLCKVPLIPLELATGDLDAVRSLARAPRELAHIPDSDWAVCPAMVAVLERALSAPPAGCAPGPAARRQRGWVAEALRALAPGRRNVDLFAVASRLHRAGFTLEETFALLEPHARRADLPLHELEQICRSATRYERPGERVVHVA